MGLIKITRGIWVIVRFTEGNTHFYATTISTELSEKHAQLTLGHLTASMTKHYADHKTEEVLLAVCDASNDIFTSMLG